MIGGVFENGTPALDSKIIGKNSQLGMHGFGSLQILT